MAYGARGFNCSLLKPIRRSHSRHDRNLQAKKVQEKEYRQFYFVSKAMLAALKKLRQTIRTHSTFTSTWHNCLQAYCDTFKAVDTRIESSSVENNRIRLSITL
jgi:hypothetical protein